MYKSLVKVGLSLTILTGSLIAEDAQRCTRAANMIDKKRWDMVMKAHCENPYEYYKKAGEKNLGYQGPKKSYNGNFKQAKDVSYDADKIAYIGSYPIYKSDAKKASKECSVAGGVVMDKKTVFKLVAKGALKDGKSSTALAIRDGNKMTFVQPFLTKKFPFANRYTWAELYCEINSKKTAPVKELKSATFNESWDYCKKQNKRLLNSQEAELEAKKVIFMLNNNKLTLIDKGSKDSSIFIPYRDSKNNYGYVTIHRDATSNNSSSLKVRPIKKYSAETYVGANGQWAGSSIVESKGMDALPYEHYYFKTPKGKEQSFSKSAYHVFGSCK